MLASIGEPLHVKRTVVTGKHVSANAFYIALAAAVTLMIIGLFLGGGMLALEREEHAFGAARARARLALGAARREGAAAAGSRRWSRRSWSSASSRCSTTCAGRGSRAGCSRWPSAGLAFGAVGTAFGALTRDVRADDAACDPGRPAVRVPGAHPQRRRGRHGSTTLVRIASAIFPFKPALDAINAGLNDADPGLAGPLAHLAVLTVAYTAVARVGLRRFA